MDASAATLGKGTGDLLGHPPVAPPEVGLRVAQDELAGELKDVVANVVGLHPQEICVLAAVSLDNEPGGGPVEVDPKALDLVLAERLG